MTDDGVLLGRAELERALNALANRLARRGASGQLSGWPLQVCLSIIDGQRSEGALPVAPAQGPTRRAGLA
jgi:hypothetical protein